MPFDNYCDLCNEWKRHIKGDYLKKTLAMPNEQEQAKQIFRQQPKSYQARYAEEHNGVESDVEKLKLAFNGCHSRDVADGTYAKVLKNARDPRRA
eukprot:6953336-Ditylum_brightwellii.AAC.1